MFPLYRVTTKWWQHPETLEGDNRNSEEKPPLCPDLYAVENISGWTSSKFSLKLLSKTGPWSSSSAARVNQLQVISTNCHLHHLLRITWPQPPLLSCKLGCSLFKLCVSFRSPTHVVSALRSVMVTWASPETPPPLWCLTSPHSPASVLHPLFSGFCPCV